MAAVASNGGRSWSGNVVVGGSSRGGRPWSGNVVVGGSSRGREEVVES